MAPTKVKGTYSVDQITLSNFRCFGEQQTARLAPLTLLVGENSTGKTSFLALVRALWDIGYRQRIPDFKEDPYDLGSFDEIAHYRSARGGRADTFLAGFASRVEPGQRFGRRQGVRKEDVYLFNTTFSRHRTGAAPTQIRIDHIRVDHTRVWVEFHFPNNGVMQVRAGTPGGTWQKVVPEDLASIMDIDQNQFWLFLNLFSQVALPRGKAESEWASLEGSTFPSDKDLIEIEACLRFVRGDFTTLVHPPAYASAPVRSKPRRTYDPTRPVRDPEGDYIPMYFADMSFRNETEWTSLQNALDAFGREAGLFDEISVKPLGKKDSEPFQIQIRKFGGRSKGPPRNLIDVGYGVSQVLPVITELLGDDAAPLFLLQQPEVHLHPSAQAALGTLFCQVASPDRQLIVETHSDHLLDRVRTDVRDGTTGLKPDDVSILFFERGDLDVRIHSLRIDEEGNILGAPAGYRSFFLEETARSLWKRQSLGT